MRLINWNSQLEDNDPINRIVQLENDEIKYGIISPINNTV